MKNLITVVALLFSTFINAQLLYDQMIIEDETFNVNTVLYNCGYNVEDIHVSIFTFVTTKDSSTKSGLILTGYMTDSDEIGNKYVFCYDKVGDEFLITFNSDYSYCSVSKVEGQVILVEFILKDKFNSKNNKI